MLDLTTIKFPEIQLLTRDAHKLRGYFGRIFEKHSPLLHNHYESGELRYRYPLVQYKVLDGIPYLIGLEEGAKLLTELFLKIGEIDINGHVFPVNNKNIETKKVDIGVVPELREYSFRTLWMALNQKNYAEYIALDDKGKVQKLKSILVGNILSFFKNMELRLSDEEKVLVTLDVQARTSKFKGHSMLVFKGDFVSNVALPDLVGIGKSVSRGFGTIQRK